MQVLPEACTGPLAAQGVADTPRGEAACRAGVPDHSQQEEAASLVLPAQLLSQHNIIWVPAKGQSGRTQPDANLFLTCAVIEWIIYLCTYRVWSVFTSHHAFQKVHNVLSK